MDQAEARGRVVRHRFAVPICLFACLLLAVPAFASMPVLDVTPAHQSIGAGAGVLLDRERALDIETVRRGPAAQDFVPLDDDVANFGFANAAVWLRFALENPGDTPVQRFLVVECSWLDELTLWIEHPDGRTVTHHFGDTLPYDAREFDHPLPVFDLELPPGTSTVHLRAAARDPLLVPIDLWSPEAFAHADRWTSLYYGLFYGAIAIMIVYNAFLFVFLRDRPYIFYVLYLLAFLAMNLTYNGFTYELAWRDSPEWVNWLHPITIYLFQIAGVLFALSFLGTRARNPLLHRFLLGLLAVLVAALLGSGLFQGLYTHVSLSIALVVVYTLTVVVAGVLSWLRGNRAARFFIIGTFSSLVGATITALVVAGVLPYQFATFHAVEFGMLVDATLLSIALADRYHLLRRERDLVEARYRDSLAEAKQRLEHEVAARTRDLEQAKEKAENLARTDSLTGINNRRAFYDYGAQAVNTAHRHGHPVALVMLDLDHFKDINDTYGHATGDALLVGVADVIRRNVRSTDVVGRVGGEEFAIVLPYTHDDDARELADKLRLAIEAMVVEHEGLRLHVTSSFGVCVLDDDQDIEGLVACADRALYLAKHGGRNQVVIGSGRGSSCSSPADAQS